MSNATVFLLSFVAPASIFVLLCYLCKSSYASPIPHGCSFMQFSLFNNLCLQTNFSLQFNVFCIYMHFTPYIVIHSVFYLLKKELYSENILESSYKNVTGFKQHRNEIMTP